MENGDLFPMSSPIVPNSTSILSHPFDTELESWTSSSSSSFTRALQSAATARIAITATIGSKKKKKKSISSISAMAQASRLQQIRKIKRKKDGGTAPKMKKRGSRTKFEEYLEMEQKKKTAGVTAEEDLALERRLAKKLKVKEGKLSVCIQDGIDDILDGINSGVATEEEMEIPSMEEVVPKVEVSRSKKRRREVIPPPQISTSVEAPKVQVLASKKRKNIAPEIGTIARKKNVQENYDLKEASAMKMEDAGVVVEEVKYVPPHLREKMSNESEELVRIQRRVRGLLNRLSEANVESIASEISSLFQVYGRRSVTEIVTAEIIGACCGGPRGNDQYAAVFAAYVAGTTAMVGMDFGAKFLASLATAFEEQYEKADSLALRNLTLLFSHLFSFSLLSSELVYELLALLCKRFEELDVSTILILLQSCGMALRAADPASMKEFIISIQERTAELKSVLSKKTDGNSTIIGKRLQFMLDMICDIKNNKRRPKDELVVHSRLKKWLQKLGVDEVQLRAVTWAGLLDPDKKGQWWLPGAPGSGSGDVAENVRAEVAGVMDVGTTEAEKMLQLAASQRMNTDGRRAVFCIVMSSEDYIDAFEKILRLKLPGKQDREVVRVILECCLQEQLYNKYYSLLTAKLCHHDKNHKFSLQYCLWDHYKQLHAMELRRSTNLARLTASVISSFALSLSVLKAVDFSDARVMTSKVVLHFRVLIECLLMENSDEVVWAVFSRIAVPPELGVLRDSLALFIHQNLLKHPVKNAKSDIKKVNLEKLSLLAKRCKLAKKALANVSGELFK